ncbi:MAG: cupin domain-containing protein [Anaerolineales bacterium]|nr:cupin domain-containing protein [Anaerolineales bacterium]MCB8962260.1 cupin domain-containing protein [Ardenticatenales bacterium]
MEQKQILREEASGSKRTTIFERSLAPGERRELAAEPEERLLYFTDGRGIISIYDPAPEGDLYELRQDIAVYMTPGIKHEIHNIGSTPLRWVDFAVSGGSAPAGELAWSAVTQRGVTVDKPAVGSGVAVTKVFDELSNPSKEEGFHLRVRDIWLRRPQKMANAEVLTIMPGRATRRHTHYDTGETSYVLYGEGQFIWDDEVIPCGAGAVVSYPLGVQRQVVNTGRFPLTYVLIAEFLD